MKNSLLIVPLDLQGQAPPRLRIVPAGKVELRDKREPFEVTPAAMTAMIESFNGDGVDLVIDWEHKTLTGERAPAAAWIKGLEAAADGLYASVEWTSDGRADVEGGKYRYHSPVFRLDPKTRQPQRLMHAGLTNTPAIKGLAPLLAAKYGESEILELRDFTTEERKKAAAEGAAMPDGSFPIMNRQDLENAVHDIGRANDPEAAKKHIIARAKALNCMDLLPADWPGSTKKMDGGKPMKKEMLKLLGFPEAEDKPDQEVLALVSDRFKLVAALPEIATALGLEKPAEATPAQIKGAILALKQGQEQLTTLHTEVAALKAENAQGKAQKEVDETLAAKKITPAQTAWALEYATRDLEGFKAYAKIAAPVLATETLKIKTKDGKGEVELTPDELAVCKQLNLTPEAFKAQRQTQEEG